MYEYNKALEYIITHQNYIRLHGVTSLVGISLPTFRDSFDKVLHSRHFKDFYPSTMYIIQFEFDEIDETLTFIDSNLERLIDFTYFYIKGLESESE